MKVSRWSGAERALILASVGDGDDGRADVSSVAHSRTART